MIYAAYPLWEDWVPGALGAEPKDIPTITVIPAKPGSARGSAPYPAVIILPGGGYRYIEDHEGAEYAEWLSASGYTCFLVKYRLATDGYRWPVMLWDAARAVRWTRCRAEEFQVDPQRVGMIGSSAGGHLLGALVTHFDGGDPTADDPVARFSSRPDLAVMCYGLYAMDLLVSGSTFIERMLGPDATPGQIDALSSVKWVRPDTPPCYLMHNIDDEKVDVSQSLAFAGALRQNGVPFEAHIYQAGGHGVALKRPHPWSAECLRWLKDQLG